MPAQKLSSFKGLPSQSGMRGPRVFELRPALAAYVMQVISAWSDAEATFGEVRAYFSNDDSHTSFEKYLSLPGWKARRRALKQAAKHSLSEGNLALLDRVMEAVNPVRECRNEFAHGVWSILDALPDALIWDPPDNDARRRELNVRQQVVPFFDETMVYRKADLADAANDAFKAAWAVRSLAMLFDPGRQVPSLYEPRLKGLLALLDGLGDGPAPALPPSRIDNLTVA